ncbi:MAG TPA: hypothetical protein VKT49_12340 [Bryobacteraceae bacterium]|nr:hypothetical protein [Bryobacteraceae bacterium]
MVTIRPDVEVQLPGVLERVGKQVERFWNYFSSVTCTEAVTQSKISEKGKVLFEQKESFDYLIILQASGMDLAVDESRVEKTHKVSKGSASLLETNGFSILTLIFHPLYQSRYQYRSLPDETVAGRRYMRVAFEQVVQDHPLSVLRVGEREYPLLWRGTAWIEPASFTVTRLQAGLGSTMAETGLLRLDADVTYSDVRFNETEHFWLPSQAVIEAETKRQHWRNTHQFSNYRRFEVQTEVKTADPQ